MKNKIEKLMKNKLIKNITYIFSGNLIGSILGIFNTSLLVQSIGLENNGIIFLGLAYAGFFNALFNFQSYEGVIKFLPSCMDYGNEDGKNIIKQAIVLDIITAILAFVLAYLSINYGARYFKWNIQTVECIRILIFTILFTLTGAFTGVLRIFEKFKYISTLGIATAIFNTLFYLIGYRYKLDLKYYIYLTLITTVLNTAQIIYYTYITLKENGMENLELTKIKCNYEFIRFTIYTNLSSTVDLPIFHLTPFIINKYLGLSEISVYKILERIGQLISKITSTISQVLMPEISKKLSKNDVKGAYEIGIKLGKIILSVGIIGFVFVVISHKYWLNYFIPDYPKYMIAVYLYLALVIFTQTFVAQHPIFIYSGYVKENTILLIIINILYILILLYMAKNFGITGIIISRILQAMMVYLTKGVVLFIKNGKKQVRYE